MSNANLKLRVTFEFEIAAPTALVADEHATLCRKLGEILGPLVLQGMPTITAKQFAKVGANILGHHHHLDAENLVAPVIDHAIMVAAAPHLTDDELTRLARQAGAKAAALQPAELKRLLRRQALALVNEFRLVPCEIEGQLKFGGDITVGATLNLTNGGVTVNEEDRRNQLKQGTGVITLVAGDVRITGNCAGHTLSGPVIDVSIDDIAAARDELIYLWSASK
ncbi:hypothetical protein FACS1894116_00660 [Betaproteobacteria bacterium]|nr:hypothetical protein FACS1894116_00660 [Betaproteobacteria bacterium]GHU28382.1 hypothetical protein FACS189497_03720 [Betaproteobacteria bacterium]